MSREDLEHAELKDILVSKGDPRSRIDLETMSSSYHSLSKGCILPFVIAPILVGVVLLLVEHRSGLFTSGESVQGDVPEDDFKVEENGAEEGARITEKSSESTELRWEQIPYVTPSDVIDILMSHTWEFTAWNSDDGWKAERAEIAFEEGGVFRISPAKIGGRYWITEPLENNPTLVLHMNMKNSGRRSIANTGNRLVNEVHTIPYFEKRGNVVRLELYGGHEDIISLWDIRELERSIGRAKRDPKYNKFDPLMTLLRLE